MPNVTPVLGLDAELANSLLKRSLGADGRPDIAARLILEAMSGFPEGPLAGTDIEYGRRWHPNGSGQYCDADHVEICLAEHTRSSQHPLLLHAMLRRVRNAQQHVQRRLSNDAELFVAANNSDGHTAWGSHVSVLAPRATFDNLAHAKPHHAGILATHLVTSVLWSGSGLVGAGNGKAACDFQLAQRPDFFVALLNNDTMVRRGIINVRDDPHCAHDLARIHIIYYDLTLNPVAARLKAGTSQLLVAMLSENFIDTRMVLDCPVSVASAVSRDLYGRTPFSMAQRGLRMTSLEIQQAIADLAGEFVSEGRAKHVPEAAEIVSEWQAVLDYLRGEDRDALAMRCDNWMKLTLLQKLLGKRGLSFRSAEAKVYDWKFASLNPEDGLFWMMAEAGKVQDMPPNGLIQHFTAEPPEDTRAYLRGNMLRRFGQFASHVDWGEIRFQIPDGKYWTRVATLKMPDPRRHNREAVEPILNSTDSLEDLVEALNSHGGDPAATTQFACS